MKGFYKLFFCSVLQALNLKKMFKQIRVYHLVHYIADFEDKIIVYVSEKPTFYNYLVNMNHVEPE